MFVNWLDVLRVGFINKLMFIIGHIEFMIEMIPDVKKAIYLDMCERIKR